MLARAAIACALLVGAGTPARADRRPVAVVNLDLGHHAAALDRVVRVGAALDQNPRLQRVPDPHDDSALRDYFEPEDDPWLATAKDALDEVRRDLEHYDVGKAITRATEALARLGNATPAAAVAPYADLAFELGIARLGEGKAAEANAEFVLVKRLAPARPLAPDLLPEIVAAYTHAKEPAGQGTLEVHGSGRIWLDGVDAGAAPGEVAAAAGPHLVQLAGPEREPRGREVVARAGQVTVAEVPDAPLSRPLQIDRARIAIATAPDAMARTPAILRLAQLLGVHDIVFVDVGPDKKIVEQTWQEETGLGAPHAPGKPEDVLDALAPPPPPAPVEPPPFVRPVEPPLPPWYRRPRYQWGIGTAIVAAIVGGIVLANHEGTFSPGGGGIVFAP